MGVKGPEHPDDEFVQFYEPKKGITRASWCVTTS